MDEVLLGLGQRTEPGLDGAPTTATGYAGLGPRHLVLVADGAVGPVPSRLAAQAAVSAVLARFRVADDLPTADRLAAAFREAHDAVRRSALGSHAEGQAGASVVAAVVEAGQITLARVGGGRAWLVDARAARSLLGGEGQGWAGDGRTPPEIHAERAPLAAGTRLVLAPEATGRTLAADLAQLCRGSSPQIAAQDLVSAARRRGEAGALAVHVVEVRSETLVREAHPAMARIDRAAPSTFDVDGRRIRPMAERRWTARGGGGTLWAAALGVAGGALTGWLTAPAPAPAPAPPPVALVTPTPPSPPPPPDTVAPPVAPEEPDADAAPAPDAEAPPHPLAERFAAGTPPEAAREVRRWLERAWRLRGEEGLDEAAAWIRAHRDQEVVSILILVLDQRPTRPVRAWLRELLPELYD